MQPPERAVRILFAIQTRWDDTAGVAQVLMELIEQFRSRGHHCEKFSQEDAFRRPLGPIRGPFTLAMFQRRLLAYIREHGHRFDVIHVEHHLLPFARSKYRFSGRLVIKSQGLIHFYCKYLRALPDGSKGTLRTRLMRNLGWWSYGGVSAADRGFLAADQIYLMNCFLPYQSYSFM